MYARSHARNTQGSNGDTCLASVAFAGIGGFIILVLDIWAIVSILSSGASTGSKVLWTLLVLILPVLGFIIWLIAGPKSSRATV